MSHSACAAIITIVRAFGERRLVNRTVIPFSSDGSRNKKITCYANLLPVEMLSRSVYGLSSSDNLPLAHNSDSAKRMCAAMNRYSRLVCRAVTRSRDEGAAIYTYPSKTNAR